MANEGTFKAWINPLAFPGVDLARAGDGVPDAEAMLSVVCRPGVPHDTGSLVDRSRRISARARVLFAAPDEPAILEKLVWPLREAKASYVLGQPPCSGCDVRLGGGNGGGAADAIGRGGVEGQGMERGGAGNIRGVDLRGSGRHAGRRSSGSTASSGKTWWRCSGRYA